MSRYQEGQMVWYSPCPGVGYPARVILPRLLFYWVRIIRDHNGDSWLTRVWKWEPNTIGPMDVAVQPITGVAK